MKSRAASLVLGLELADVSETFALPYDGYRCSLKRRQVLVVWYNC